MQKRIVINPGTWGRDGDKIRKDIYQAARNANMSISLWASKHLEAAARRELAEPNK